MKILVAVKRVVDYNIKVRIKPNGSDVDIEGVKMGINPFDENALEEALRLKEKGIATEVVAVSLGTSVENVLSEQSWHTLGSIKTQILYLCNRDRKSVV